MAQEPQHKDEIQGVFSDGDGNVFYDSWAEANGRPSVKNVKDIPTAEQIAEEFPDKDRPAKTDG